MIESNFQMGMQQNHIKIGVKDNKYTPSDSHLYLVSVTPRLPAVILWVTPSDSHRKVMSDT